MIILHIIAGMMSGWILVEFIIALSNVSLPLGFNISLAFVGGLIGYSLYI